MIINVHHFADWIIEYLSTKNNFGMRIEISSEDLLLDTGGGLKNAAWFFLENSRSVEETFLLHNVDVLSSIDFEKMANSRKDSGALASLAVQARPTSRHLLFDEQLRLCGRAGQDGRAEMVRPCPQPQALAFCGIHVISTRLFPLMIEKGAYSIIDAYLRLAGAGEKIQAFRADPCYWRDLGKPEDLAQASHDLEHLTTAK